MHILIEAEQRPLYTFANGGWVTGVYKLGKVRQHLECYLMECNLLPPSKGVRKPNEEHKMNLYTAPGLPIPHDVDDVGGNYAF